MLDSALFENVLCYSSILMNKNPRNSENSSGRPVKENVPVVSRTLTGNRFSGSSFGRFDSLLFYLERHVFA